MEVHGQFSTWLVFSWDTLSVSDEALDMVHPVLLLNGSQRLMPQQNMQLLQQRIQLQWDFGHTCK
jgi:hypothetical protein